MADTPQPDPTESIQSPTDPRVLADRHQQSVRRPERIGPYRILDELGEGGMGVVYLAEQDKPIHRRVALKVIKLGMNTKQVIARFETEREALALMNHPNVARVFDAGVTDDGRPYFAMEHVPGLRITDYCDMHRLTTNERLHLFADVCNAVQHAHQKGIIHRDIKPSNVLVAVQDDKPVVKVIDFGVAKATQQRLTEHTLFTEQGQLIGTPGYMSPEQAEMTALDIDTRTDIYSLGVLLYELLVGARPFDEKVLRQAGQAEIQRIIREVDPPKPSTKLSNLGAHSSVIAQKRYTVPKSLAKELRGDLDWIVMKCLEKDRARRYPTANGLAQEIERHLHHEPVLAGPPARIYRLRKFLRKHRGPVGAVVIVFVVLTAGLFASTWSYLRAERQRQRADTEALTSARIKEFLVGLFKVSSPDEALGRAITAREILDRGAGRIRAELTDQPLVQAALADTIGTVYANLGLYDTAERLLQEVLSLRQRNLPELHVDTAATLDHLGSVLNARGKYAEAERVHREALAMRQKLVGREHAAAAESLAHLASAVFALDRRSEAEELHNEALAIRRKVLGPDDPVVASSLLDLARLARARDDVEDAERLYREALDMRIRALGRLHPDSVETLYGLAGLLYRKGDHKDSERLYREVLAMYKTLYGEEDTNVAACLNNLAVLLAATQRHDEAEPVAREALRINLKRIGPEHAQIASDLNTLGMILRRKGDYEESERLHRSSLAMRLKLFGPDNEYTGVSRLMLGTCLMKMSRYEEAESEMLETLRIFRTALGDRHGRTVDALKPIIELYGLWGKPDQEARYRELLAAPTTPPP